MITGLGIDIEKPERFSKEKLTKNLKNKLFNAVEQEYCEKSSNVSVSYASCFASKEAVIKAFSQSKDRILSFKDIEIIRTKKNPPQVRIKGEKKLSVFLSISHAKDIVTTICIIQEGGE